MKNKIFNEDCMVTLDRMVENGVMIDGVITSPFYNTNREKKPLKEIQGNYFHLNYRRRYDEFNDMLTEKEYIDFTVKLFNKIDNVLIENGCILYNMSYGTENIDLMYKTIYNIIDKTAFTVVDTISWKKKNALPNSVSHNRLTRICEFIFVIVRKSEVKTFNANKEISSIRSNGQKMYKNYYNYIEARNNDGSCDLNKATYSSELVEKLINIYFKENSLIYDCFMGTGTTAIGCIKCNCNYIGSEISKRQVDYSLKRIKEVLENDEI